MRILRGWAVRSQQGSRRNAMIATTELTRLRIERDEVAAYLAGRVQRAAPAASPAVGAVAATR